jgi:hypothetical protein
MSTVFSPTPSQSFLRPAPDPPPSTTGEGKSKFSPNASETMVAYGRTVDDPVTWTLSLANAVDATAKTNVVLSKSTFIQFLHNKRLAVCFLIVVIYNTIVTIRLNLYYSFVINDKKWS